VITRQETGWLDANQSYLVGALAELRSVLVRHSGCSADTPMVHPSAEADGKSHTRPAALETLCTTFELSRFERSILLLCAGMELDSSFPALCAEMQGDPGCQFPTFSLALAALDDPHWSAIAPSGPLRSWRLIEIVGRADRPLTTSPLKIDERILHYLVGLHDRDERFRGLLEPIYDSDLLVNSQQFIARQIGDVWKRAVGDWPLVELSGSDESGKQAIALAACKAAGLELWQLSSREIPSSGVESEAIARLCERETRLSPGALYVEAECVEPGDAHAQAVNRFLERFTGPSFLSTRTRWGAMRRPAHRVDVGKPTASEQRSLWRSLLGPAAVPLHRQIDRLVAQFHLNAGAIQSSVADVLTEGGEPECMWRGLWDASRAQSRPRLDDLAERIEPIATWDDLVLTAAEHRSLRTIEAQVAHRGLVYDTWGFGAGGGRGLGITALFSGSSGTGKTLAAEILAGALRLDLYRIDLSCVVSKYIGETEKNLRRVFDAAEDGGAILFFDEADALFGKRGEVKDSHDRYANIQINYLLQRMESYRGLAVLATNRKGDLDPAFLRRIRFVVNFPFPEAAQRAEIWRRVFPRQTPTEGLDIDQLARLGVPGGNIRNIALHAAFLAATEDKPVRMSHLHQAARNEFAKMEKPWTPAESAGW
jgi:hypothetical protein